MGVGVHDGIVVSVTRSFDHFAAKLFAAFNHTGLPGDNGSVEAHAHGVQASLDVLTAVMDERT